MGRTDDMGPLFIVRIRQTPNLNILKGHSLAVKVMTTIFFFKLFHGMGIYIDN